MLRITNSGRSLTGLVYTAPKERKPIKPEMFSKIRNLSDNPINPALEIPLD